MLDKEFLFFNKLIFCINNASVNDIRDSWLPLLLLGTYFYIYINLAHKHDKLESNNHEIITALLYNVDTIDMYILKFNKLERIKNYSFACRFGLHSFLLILSIQ